MDASQLALLFDELVKGETPESAKACIKVPDAPALQGSNMFATLGAGTCYFPSEDGTELLL